MKWLREAFSDDKGNGSMTRICMFLLMLTVLYSIGYATYKSGILPNPPDNLVSLVEWLFGICVTGTTATKGIPAVVAMFAKGGADANPTNPQG